MFLSTKKHCVDRCFFHSYYASCQVAVSSRMIEEDVTARTVELLKELVIIIYISDIVVIAKQFNVFVILFNAPLNQFTK